MSDKKENWGGFRKGAGRPLGRPPGDRHRVVFDLDKGDYVWMANRATNRKLTLAAILRQAIRFYRENNE